MLNCLRIRPMWSARLLRRWPAHSFTGKPQRPHARREYAVKIVDPCSQPLMLARPIRFILWIGIVKRDRNSTISAFGERIPVKGAPELALDSQLLIFQKRKILLSPSVGYVEFGA